MALTDITFDPISRDLLFAPNGDFLVNENCSTQDGAILLEARVMNIQQPEFGIGYNSQILGSNAAQAAFQLNRWVSQVQQDNGGGKAAWQRNNNPPNIQFDFTASVDYQG